MILLETLTDLVVSKFVLVIGIIVGNITIYKGWVAYLKENSAGKTRIDEIVARIDKSDQECNVFKEQLKTMADNYKELVDKLIERNTVIRQRR